MDIRTKIGQKIRELRKGLELTQEALSGKADVDKTYLNEVENGKRNISVVNLEKIIVSLEVTIQDFFTNEVFNGTTKKVKKTK